MTVTKDITLYAQWKEKATPAPTPKPTPAGKVTVTFDSNGGSPVPPQILIVNEKAKKPKDPKRRGYIFKGWYANKKLTKIFDFDQKITKDITVYAKWKKAAPKVKKYTVTFVTNGGSKIKPQRVEKGKTAKKPKDPTRRGYTFKGWYANKKLTKKYSFKKKIVKDTRIYAKWKKSKVSPKPVPKPAAVLLLQGTPSGKRGVKATWNAVPGADKYLVYGAHCGKKLQRMQVTKKTGLKVVRIKGKKLKAHQPYKFCVFALNKKGKVIAVSNVSHVITAMTMGRYANIRSITAQKTKLTLKKGQRAQVRAKIDGRVFPKAAANTDRKLHVKITMPKGKKHLSRKHITILRCVSSNPKVVSVSKTGIVKAKRPGKATLYIQDTGGKYCKVKITVH